MQLVLSVLRLAHATADLSLDCTLYVITIVSTTGVYTVSDGIPYWNEDIIMFMFTIM